MAKKGFPGDTIHAIVDAVMKGSHERNQTIKIAKQLKDAGLPSLRAREAASTLVYSSKDKDKAHAALLKKLQGWGYVSRQAR